MISDFHVKNFQTGCTLQSITSVEMAWKSHWAWHLGSAIADSSSSGGGGGTATLERQIQSLSDKVAGINNGARNGAVRGRGGRRGGKRFNAGANGGGKKKEDGNGGKGQGGFNKNGIPKPPGRGKGNGGKSVWAKRARNNFQKK